MDDKSGTNQSTDADTIAEDRPVLDKFLDNTPSEVLESEEPAEAQKP